MSHKMVYTIFKKGGPFVLEAFAFYLSFFMTLLLVIRGYMEAITIAESNENKVNGGTLIFCVVFALIFSKLMSVFYPYY
jgi:hypothetical protein